MLIKDLLIRQKFNDNVAVTCGKNKVTYAQLFEIAEKTAQTIKPYVTNYKNIAILFSNSIEYIISFFSILFLDKVVVPIEHNIKQNELENILNYCDIGLVLIGNDHVGLLKNACESSRSNIIIFNMESGILENKDIDKCANISDCSDDVAILMHTSGSTNSPRRVMLTNKNIISNIEANVEALNISKADTTLISLPMCFSYCNTAQFLSHIYCGAKLVIMDTIFLPATFFALVEKEKITNFMTVPTIAKTLLIPKIQKPLKSLKWISIGGASIDNRTLKNLLKSFKNIDFIKTYGLTEASPRVTTLLAKDCKRKMSSIGKAMKGIQIKIILENGNEAKEHENGELLVKGSNIMEGYYNNKEETNKIIKDGWLHTGDIGFLDEEGYIYLVGRKKNIIISSGINIYPEEVEEILMAHPAIELAYVYGISDNAYGEIPLAKVIIKKGAKVTDIELIQYCKEKLSDYKIPSKITFVNELQYTNNMKIKRIGSLNGK